MKLLREHGGVAKIPGIAILSCVLVGSSSLWFGALAESTNPPARPTTPSVAQSREAWQASMTKLALPQKTGCFTARYPKIEWQGGEDQCTSAPSYPQPLRVGPPRPRIVGGLAGDYSAQVSQGTTISSAEGSFDTVDGVTSETGTDPLTGTANVPNTFSLQLNSQPTLT